MFFILFFKHVKPFEIPCAKTLMSPVVQCPFVALMFTYLLIRAHSSVT